MTIEFRPPRPGEESGLRELFSEAFGDRSFTELFFRRGYGPDRCLAAFGGELLAALHWFDCRLDGKKAAYLYAIAAFKHCRGLGIGSKLILEAVGHLKRLGYGAVFLVPAEPSLFGYYERLGFRTVGTIREERITAGTPLPLRRLTAAEYAESQKNLLPEHSLIQEGPCLELLSGYADFYTTGRSVAAVTEGMIWELLGDISDAPGLIAALGLHSAAVRTPGPGRPFVMGIGMDGPIHLGLALD